jgi:hypothetical protein
MSSLLPQSQRDFLTFAEAFDALGHAIYRKEWTGEEKRPVPWEKVYSEDVLKKRQEYEALCSCYDWTGEYLDDFFYWDEEIDLWLEVHRDDPEKAKDMARAKALKDELAALPPPTGEEYERLCHLEQRQEKTLRELRTLLADGWISAFYWEGHVRAPITAEQWTTQRKDFAIAESEVPLAHGWGREIVMVNKAEAEALFKKYVPNGGSVAQIACREALEKMMREAPDSRPTKEKLRTLFPDVSEREFQKLWGKAIKKTGVDWSKPGRRRTAV